MKRATELLNNIKLINQELESLPGTIHSEEFTDNIDLYKIFIRDKELIKVTQKLFEDGHHARAVEEAFKLLNNFVKKKANTNASIDGAKLMKQIFSVNNPILKLNSGITHSEKDEQLGYMEIFSGCMTGIRNPRAHEHEWEDTELHALQLLILADHLVEKIRNSLKE